MCRQCTAARQWQQDVAGWMRARRSQLRHRNRQSPHLSWCLWCLRGMSKWVRSRWMLCGRVNRDGSPSLGRSAYMVQLFPLRNITLFVYYPFRDQSYTEANLIHTNLIHKGEARQTGIIGARAFASGSRLDTRCESAKSFRPASAWSTRPHSNFGLQVGSNIAHEHRPKIGSRNTLLPDRPSQRDINPLRGVF